NFACPSTSKRPTSMRAASCASVDEPRRRPSMYAKWSRRLLPALFLLLALPLASRAAEPAAKVYVILWFDTEDYILPADDGVAPTCYGQPGSSWGPQSYGAMRKWGMNVYLDAGRHFGLDGKPCYYDGVLNLYNLDHILRTDLTGLPAEEKAEDKFTEAHKAL